MTHYGASVISLTDEISPDGPIFSPHSAPSEPVADRLRLILGVKLRALRQERELGLKEVAGKAGLSVSYLSEIEKGKKYPKPDKLVDLAHALGVAYDDLVSLRVDKGLGAVKSAIDSPLLRSFPFELFGVDPEALVALLASADDKADALVRAVTDVTRAYDARVEDFLLAALRAYQQIHGNTFPELEAVADRLRADLGATDPDTLRAALEGNGYRIDTERLAADPALATFRQALGADAGDGPTLYVNGALASPQLAFLYARELAFLALDAQHRPRTSPWVRVDRFEQVLDNFQASYVAGAVLLPAADVDAALAALAALVDAETWDPAAVAGLLGRFGSTPEMLFHRLTQRVPEALGLDELYLLRFHHETAARQFQLTKTFNLSRVPVPHGVEADEHYCRRWPSFQALAALDRRQARAAGRGETDDGPVVLAQRQRFVDSQGDGSEGDGEFFVVAIARPLALQPGVNSAVSLGLRLTGATRRHVRFWDDPELPRVDVSLTCERCPISDCRVRAAPPTVLRAREAREARQSALDAL